jgi:ribonucleoside-diphosphate reductase beta chain
MKFGIDALPVELIRMNSAMMCINYIKFCSGQLFLCLRCNHHFKIGNPFEWMEMISLQGKTNLSSRNVSANTPNRKSGVGIDRVDQSFALDASF